jgi:protein-S-isoprenylcysteine O-methyltransferase Ste14
MLQAFTLGDVGAALIAQWGDQYRAYKQRVGDLITPPKGSK